MRGSPAGRDDVEAELDQLLDRRQDIVLVRVLDRDEGGAALRQEHPGAKQGLGEGDVEILIDSHDFARALHLRSEHGIGAWETRKGEYWPLDGDIAQVARDRIELAQRRARHDPRRHLGDGRSDRLGDEGDRAARARIDLDQIDLALLDRELDVHQSLDLERPRQLSRLPLDLDYNVGIEAMRRDRAGAVARMHPRFLDMLEHAAYDHLVAVADGVDIDFDRIPEIAVDQDRR